ncbi:hypothetical protein OIE62_00610 [Streptomyces scopuliridis]|uniref:Uncharacterized protein n=1 Tax=Streptomyces scopuliridis TaxID=452529 RepID=A0ACD4ZXM7_9ACTN|nr:hypothetical protein [Streptomyces scopuliridis]WSB38339.1 hypothetical protein OG949_39695 [Streptomyces scopuliridis]WSC02777.1 hypothetical protein OG835_41220 [Streptomyces scopuliridis]WSC03689.1 hypothetical protein OIE62_00610 [Streptomyces scopuliridis]
MADSPGTSTATAGSVLLVVATALSDPRRTRRAGPDEAEAASS